MWVVNAFHTNEQAYRPHNCRVSRVLITDRYAARTLTRSPHPVPGRLQ